MKRTIDHEFKVGDEITIFHQRGSARVPSQISTITRVTKVLIDLASGRKIDLRNYSRFQWPHKTTDEDREYLAKETAEREARSQALREQDQHKEALRNLFPETKPCVSNGFQPDCRAFC